MDAREGSDIRRPGHRGRVGHGAAISRHPWAWVASRCSTSTVTVRSGRRRSCEGGRTGFLAAGRRRRSGGGDEALRDVRASSGREIWSRAWLAPESLRHQRRRWIALAVNLGRSIARQAASVPDMLAARWGAS
jgi:hypothetical protein